MPANKRKEWYVGVDLGTGSCKSVIIDAEAQILGFGAGDYSKIEAPTRWKEHNPEALTEALIRSVRKAVYRAEVSPQACQGISVSGALHSLIAIDQSRKPLTGILTWIDARAVNQAAAVRTAADAQQIYQQTGCPVHSMYPIYKLIWLREKEPHIFKNSTRFVSAKAYVIERLTGQFMADFSIASGSGLLNVHDLTWNAQSLQLAGVAPEQLSSVTSPWKVINGLKPELASAMGIPMDVPLVIGSSDAVNSSLGAGAVRSECATCMVGTSGAYRIIAKKAILDPTGRSWCYAIDPHHWLVGGAINNGGIVLSWFREALNKTITAGPEEEKLSFDELINLAANVKAGAAGLICLPFLAGERSPNWNMNTRGVFFGLTLDHSLDHMIRALLEGVAFRLRSLAELMDEIGCETNEIRVSGGLTRSGLWPQIIASALNLELHIPRWGETSSLGAALWTLLGTGVIDDFEKIKELIPLGRSYSPVAEDAKRYHELYLVYKELYSALGGSFDKIANLYPLVP
jgi:gluconokinase